MIKYAIKQWANKPFQIILLLTGYMIGILVVSLGISGINEARENTLISTSGNPKHISLIQITANQQSKLLHDNIVGIISELAKTVEVQVLNSDIVKIEENISLMPKVVPLMYSELPEWQAPILFGRHLKPEETLGSEQKVVIGKELYNIIFPYSNISNSSITIGGDKYRVIGVVGKKSRATQFDYIVYMPLKSIPNSYKKKLLSKSDTVLINSNDSSSNVSHNSGTIGNSTKDEVLSLAIRKNGEAPVKEVELLKGLFKEYSGNNVNFMTGSLPEANNEDLVANVIFVITIGGIILSVTVINVMNLSLFWILDRRREFAIKKALGATDGVIIKSILLELLSITVVAAILAVFIHVLIQVTFYSLFQSVGISMTISWLNWLVAILVAIICGIITSVTPVKAVLKMEVVEALRVD